MSSNVEDVLVIGGGAAGLNAALVLSRARRQVLVVDSGRPRNAPAHQLHGFVSAAAGAKVAIAVNWDLIEADMPEAAR
ncbi:FAD-dependent oxidoreductase [Saccharopolyspora hattusasensis]|uniref:FAD-dependent oxidoreductase n=1 Tax=Saccharopolyspora hattusasensis TaxID=1128679 RepID=UPI003D95EDE5